MDPTNQATRPIIQYLQAEKEQNDSPPTSPLIEVTWEKSSDGIMSPVFVKRVMPSSDAVK